MEWFDYCDDPDFEGGVLEFDTRLELHVFQRLEDGEAVAVWLSDDARYFCQVEVGQA
jgi:hypothetical protein